MGNKNDELVLNYSMLKVFVIIGSITALVGRSVINEDNTAYYMAFVNVASLFISYNIVLVGIYFKIKNIYKSIKDNLVKPNAQNFVMLLYILIFAINILVWIIVLRLYITHWQTPDDLILFNDNLSIISLCLAITSDFISGFISMIYSGLFIKP